MKGSKINLTQKPMKEDLTKYSGEEYYKRPARLQLDEFRLQGNDGHFLRIKKEGEEYVKEKLGNQITGVFLRIRRRLVNFKGKMSTSEHNTTADDVVLFNDGKQEKGIAKELREKYPTLKTEQIVYFFDLASHQLVRLTVHGSSLGSENKPADSVPFYEYLGTYKGDEHVWEYATICSAKAEKGALGEYYAIHFERGNKLDDATFAIVSEKMKMLHDTFIAQDTYYKTLEKKETAKQDALEKQESKVIPVTDEIKAEDLDF